MTKHVEDHARQSDEDRLDSETFEIKSYRIDIDPDSKAMRIVFFNLHGQKTTLGYLELSSPGAYDFAAEVLKQYDKLEGIK